MCSQSTQNRNCLSPLHIITYNDRYFARCSEWDRENRTEKCTNVSDGEPIMANSHYITTYNNHSMFYNAACYRIKLLTFKRQVHVAHAYTAVRASVLCFMSKPLNIIVCVTASTSELKTRAERYLNTVLNDIQHSTHTYDLRRERESDLLVRLVCSSI